MKKFNKKVLRFIGIFFLIILVPIALYVRKDVYNDFRVKENYSWKFFFQQLGDLSTKKLLSNSIDYDSFVFGSSRSTSVYACYLQQEIEGSRFFHYANWNETVGGIERKMNLLDSLGYPINNVIIYIDTDYTFSGDGTIQHADHFLLTNTSRFHAIIAHFNSFFKNLTFNKIKILFGLKVPESIFPNWTSDIETNDGRHVCADSIIAVYGKSQNKPSYISEIDSLIECGFLYERSVEQIYGDPQISKEEELMLYHIKAIIEKHDAEVYVVVTPIYDQLKFSLRDQKILDDCFGDRLFDFSGINEITSNPYNYPDRKHFQTGISKMILDSILIQ